MSQNEETINNETRSLETSGIQVIDPPKDTASAQKKRTQENLIFNDFVPCWSQRSVPEVLHAKHSFEWKNARWQFFFSQQGGLSGMKLFGNCRVWNHLCQLLAWIFFPKSVAALLRSARKKWIRNSHVKSTGGRVGCCHCQEKLDEIGRKMRRKK